MNQYIEELFNTNINELRELLYKKYSRYDIAEKLNIKERQVSMLLTGKSILSYKQYLILKEMLN